MSKKVKKEILDYLKEVKNANPNVISQMFNLTTSTTRRYLLDMEKNNLIERSFGEVSYIEKNENIYLESLNKKSHQNQNIKRILAEKATKLIRTDTPVYIDSGSSSILVLEFLDKSTIIYTSSILVAFEATKNGFRDINLIGGKLNSKTLSTINHDEEKISNLYFGVSVIGVNAISENEELTTTDEQEGLIKKIVSQNSDLIIVIAEKEKLGRKLFYDFTPENTPVIVITDNNKKPNFANKLTYIYNKQIKNTTF